MPEKTAPIAGQNHSPSRPLRVLLVDAEPQVHQAVAECLKGLTIQLIHASSLAQARRHLARLSADLALIDHDQSDGDGLELAGEIHGNGAVTQTIILSRNPSLSGAVEAIRAGAADFITKPLNPAELTERVDQVRLRYETVWQQKRKVRRLKRVCRKLNNVRKEMAQQVDIICKDLVMAYQEVAEQMNQVVQTSEFSALVRQELDLEQLLRKSLEFLLQKAGSTNAAIFLPTNSDGYSVGGYVNYDCTTDSADILLQHLADVLAPRLANLTEPIHLIDDNDLKHWLDGDAAFLTDNHLIAFACRYEDEPLAVVVLFRGGSESYDSGLPGICNTVGAVMGECLARVTRINDRHVCDDDGGLTWDQTC